MTRNENDEKNLQTKRITDFGQIKALYKSRMKKDFVRSELKSLFAMRRSWEKNAYECYGLFEGSNILGYAFFVRLNRRYLLDYLAVEESRRGQGLGSVFLRELAHRMKDADCVIAEVEDPEQAKDEAERALRERRLRFYLRNGYVKTALASVVFGVDYRILEAASYSAHPVDQLRELYAAFYQSMLPALLFHTQFRISQPPSGS